MKRVSPILLVQACLLLFLSSGARAADFPPITDEERAVTSVPGEPNAPAVVLFRKGEFLMAGYGGLATTGSLSSSLRIQVRVKVLTEEGKSNGELSVAHDDSYRLKNFTGRTVLPDGRVIPLPKDAKFVRKTSRSQKTFVTAVAFPSVEVGAILDYQYELWFDSIFYLNPWYFSVDLPVRYSEIVFKAPLTLQAKGWSRSPQGVKIESETQKQTNGYIVRAWARNVPSLPDDPYGPPYTDLAAQMLLLPSAISTAYVRESLFESWPATCELIGGYYDEALRRDSGVAQKARSLAPSGTPRQRVEALYRFVRDEIDPGPYIGVVVSPDVSLGKVLSKQEGSRAEKALLLQALLKAVKVGSRLIWVRDRNDGTVDPQLPNPAWFDTVLVMVELDGQRVFLDPTDSSLGFGQLQPGYEGSLGLIYDKKKPEEIVLPETPFDQNVRRAEVDLVLDEKGRLTGTGTLRLTGHHAWEKTDWQEDEAKTLEAWKSWLAESYRDFQISDVKVTESPDERKVLLTWAMAQREEEVLGDEASVVPSAPLGPISQPFVQPASSRRSGVVFDYADRDEVELRLRWPEGWKVESLPRTATLQSGVGALDASVEVKEGEHSLVYRRRMDVTKRTISSTRDYEAVRSLYGEVEKSDAQALLLVRR
jgi:Domain of Unknown Function with PDB structure (DUF3857)/Domain of Unknown Function with PDB structure (DUF3858)